ncbi:MAG: hypothetical protein LBJ00_03050 [Planctomycetaceae bacterium]|jgi:hypothetical protein|nr:hypothetical protein [Planctomycetaceae bacterium]
MVTYKPALLRIDGQIEGDSEAVILYPQEWIGKQFPLQGYIDIPIDIPTSTGYTGVGKWMLILYRADCTRCEKHFVELKRRNDSGVNIVCLEIDGLSQNALRNRFGDGKWYWGSLKSVKKWFVETPTILTIEDGSVKSVKTE